MLTTNAWVLGLILAVGVIAAIVGIFWLAQYFTDHPEISGYIGVPVILLPVLGVFFGIWAFLKQLYEIDAYRLDLKI